MVQRQIIELAKLVDGQRFGWFNARIVLLSLLVQISDGYDLAAISYAAPGLIRDWHIAPSTLGPIFSVGIIGMAAGGPLFGFIGDRYGRRTAIILAMLIYGLFSLATIATSTLDEVLPLRFITGVGLGGLLPNTIALNAEFAPKRMRATLIIIMFLGLSVGGILPSVVATLFEVSHGWRVFFLVGGIGPLVLVALVYFLLPESIKFLGARGDSRAEIVGLAQRLRPDLVIEPDAEFILPPEQRKGKSSISPALLFGDGLGWITFLVWLLFVADLMVNFFVNSWMPTLFSAAGMSIQQTAMTQAMYYVGGITGGLTISRFVDKWGFAAITVFFVIGCPVVASIGMPGLSQPALMGVVFLTGVCVLGSQQALNAVTGMIYPTAIRSKGAGWANAVGRLGSITGPLIGGWLIARHSPMQELFLAPLIPLTIGAGAAFTAMILCHRRFRGLHLDETAAPSAPSRARTPRAKRNAPMTL